MITSKFFPSVLQFTGLLFVFISSLSCLITSLESCTKNWSRPCVVCQHHTVSVHGDDNIPLKLPTCHACLPTIIYSLFHGFYTSY